MDFPTHFQQIFQQLNHQRLHAQLCDCVVVVGGQNFRAHRSILAACSSHFKALLGSSDSGERGGADLGGGGGPSVMKLDPEVVTPEAFSTLLDMIYTSTLSLRASNVMDVLLAASHLHLNTVVKACKLHLSRKNFPASPPKGWRSVQQQQQCSQKITSGMEENVSEEEDHVVVEVSQSVGGEDQGGWRSKRKSHEDLLEDRKRSCRLLEGDFKEYRSSAGAEEPGEELLSTDCLKVASRLWEEKYEAPKGEFEEIQLPSQSDSSTGGAVVKVKVGDEEGGGGEEQKMEMIEVKKENQSSYSSEFHLDPNHFLPSPPAPHLDSQLHDEKMSTAGPTEGDVGSLHSQLCSDLKSGPQGEAGGVDEDSVDPVEGLDSLSELTFSCFLNASSESVVGVLDEEDSLASLTAAAGITSSAGPDADGAEPGQNAEPSSSLLFPAPSVPLQRLLPTQVSGFSDTLILQPTHSPLTGFLSGLRLDPPLIKPSKAVATTFRRIAPKVPPGSEAGPDPPSAPAGDAADRPPLTRASDEVRSKCKKAAAEDLVLLVEGEKRYACKICTKTFMNLTDCKKHIRIHTGEKPYHCPKCGKRFSQSSHLYKHSKNTCVSWRDDPTFPDTLL